MPNFKRAVSGMRQSTVQPNRNNLVYLQSTQIHENPLNDSVYTSDHEQEDEQLYQSILENGILQPLTVVPHPQLPLEYLLVAGHRRLKAAKRARIKSIPCLISDVKTESDALRSQINLVETNMLSRNRTQAEKAAEIKTLERLYKELKQMDASYKGQSTRQLIASAMQMSERQVADYQDVNKNLPEEHREAFVSGELSLKAAKEILKSEKTPKSSPEPTVRSNRSAHQDLNADISKAMSKLEKLLIRNGTCTNDIKGRISQLYLTYCQETLD